MKPLAEQPVIDFYRYPPLGPEDWRYAFAAAKVRAIESSLLSKAAFADIANTPDFASAVELLGGTEYTIDASASLSDIENMLIQKRSEARTFFISLMLDENIVVLLRAREDFANMRLALRRIVTEKPLGLDYSNEGSVCAEQFEEIFAQENYERLPAYLQEAVEQAILGYYQDKDIRQIDYAIDRVQAAYRVKLAAELGSVFCLSYYRILSDITNIRTLLRLKMAEDDRTNLFLPGGFVEIDKFIEALNAAYEQIVPLFFATPYYEVLEHGIAYLKQQQSFLGLERECSDYMTGFLKSARSVTAGYQPVVSYFLTKESEIRTVRMLLSGKINGIDSKLLIDRIGQD